MPKFGPVSRKDLIRYLRNSGFIGPESGTRHQFMTKGDIHLILPNPHKGDISKNLLHRILKQANISRGEWEKL